MPPQRRNGFFTTPVRPEDEAARQREVEALLAPRRVLVQDVPVERIRPNPFQARTTFEGLDELGAAIRTLGFTSRLRIRPDPLEPDYFQLVYGERRLRAARLAGLAYIPCELADHSDDELLEIGLAENIQRQDLNPLEEARAFATFIRERGYSVRRLAERIGKEKGYVENRLNLLRMPDDVQAMVAQRPDTLVAAREIAKLDTPEQRAPLIAQVIDGGLATTAVRMIVRDVTRTEPGADPVDVTRTEVQPSAAPHHVPSHLGGSDPATDLVIQKVHREAATIRSILERWERLASEDREAAALLLPAMNDIIVCAERVANLLHTDDRLSNTSNS